MTSLTDKQSLEEFLNRPSMISFLLGIPIQKGLVGQKNQYKFVVNSNDHEPAHIHIAVNNHQIAKYDLETGKPLNSINTKLDKVVADWLKMDTNQQDALSEWQRFHGEKR